MAALLNAFEAHPNASFLAVGCDYPMLSTEHLQKLIKASLQTSSCTASYNILDCIYEPLISVYQNNIKEYLENNFKQSKYSLRAFLEEINADVVIPDKQIQIMSIDTQQDRESIMAQLRK
jgi:molybdopterin-guanine dinucleotide biosynthesis protein A